MPEDHDKEDELLVDDPDLEAFVDDTGAWEERYEALVAARGWQ